jgi:hypothetical protein
LVFVSLIWGFGFFLINFWGQNPMPVSQWFCWQMGITAAVHTLGMLLIFVPFMALDARRTKVAIKP